MENTSLISNLPNDTTNPTQNEMNSQTTTNHYQPMNIHPNPYGIQQNNQVDMPQQTKISSKNQQMNNEVMVMNEQMMNEIQQMPPQHLPSRDIPQNPTLYTNDEEIQPNYVPMPKKRVDFVSEEEIMTEKKLKDYERRLKKENKLDMIFTEIQIPIFIAILYFLFQLPIVNTMLLQYFSFLAIYSVDGNFNFIGLLLKSMLFGIVYYILNQSINLLSDI